MKFKVNLYKKDNGDAERQDDTAPTPSDMSLKSKASKSSLMIPGTPGLDEVPIFNYSYPPTSNPSSPTSHSTRPSTPDTRPSTPVGRPKSINGATFVRQLPPFKIPDFPQSPSFADLAGSVAGSAPPTPVGWSPSIKRTLLAENPLASATSIEVLPDPDTGYAWIFLLSAFSLDFLTWGFSFRCACLLGRS